MAGAQLEKKRALSDLSGSCGAGRGEPSNGGVSLCFTPWLQTQQREAKHPSNLHHKQGWGGGQSGYLTLFG